MQCLPRKKYQHEKRESFFVQELSISLFSTSDDMSPATIPGLPLLARKGLPNHAKQSCRSGETHPAKEGGGARSLAGFYSWRKRL